MNYTDRHHFSPPPSNTGEDNDTVDENHLHINNLYSEDKPSASVSTSVVLHGADSRWGKSVDDVESTASRTDISTVGQTVGSSLADFDAAPAEGGSGKVASFPVRPTTTSES